MGRILAITNQKGGVGKTTSSVNLAASLAVCGKKVLLLDLDPQGNATMGSGVNKHDLDKSIYHVLTGKHDIKDTICIDLDGGYDLLPANADLTAAEVELMHMDNKEFILKKELKKVIYKYDFILIDCPPSLNMLTVNAVVAAGSVIIPMQCEYYALEGLSALIDTITGIRNTINPDLRIEGLLRTMYDPRASLTTEVSRQLISHFGDQVYKTVIPRNIRLAEAPSHGMTVLAYDKHSRGAIAYLALAGELLRKHELEKTEMKVGVC
ncbi:MAG: ParA family protein [Candidatus Endonucleobacter bathymodioli]|uniref:ParA family protein n=1 Tax=Candidatus Endonucleibacter bathymodioli TaxID=539814 RepID=A0AA90NZ45_9GAMM|nr:ParA family protein [Candidatus Endonucleobacter bathymodioli]MDP0590313.1 ParA family protein [Candidatus Endonucleobacter bathymodioli]